MCRAVRMLTHNYACFYYKRLIYFFHIAVIIEWLIINDLTNTSLYHRFKTIKAWTQCHKEACKIGGSTLARSEQNSILFCVYTEARFISLVTRSIGSATRTTALIAVFHAKRRSIITGTHNSAIYYNQRTDWTTLTI